MALAVCLQGRGLRFGVLNASFGAIVAISLGGCVESTSPTAEAPSTNRPEARATGRGVSVSLASLSGAPQPVEDRIRDAFAAQASERDIVLADPKKAAYLIRGYLTTYPAEKGTAVAVVYDVFDAQKRRAQRLEDGVVLKDAGDPWSNIDDAALGALAAKSANDLAAFLATTPEALAALEPAQASVPEKRLASRTSTRLPHELSASADLDGAPATTQRTASTQPTANNLGATELR